MATLAVIMFMFFPPFDIRLDFCCLVDLYLRSLNNFQIVCIREVVSELNYLFVVLRWCRISQDFILTLTLFHKLVFLCKW